MRVEIVYVGDGGASYVRDTFRCSRLIEAEARARHELDVGRYLAAAIPSPALAPVSARIFHQGQIVWSLTALERRNEREDPFLFVSQPVPNARRARPQLRMRKAL